MQNFIKGFLIGKGSFFEEKATGIYGFKVIYRSRIFVEDLARILADHCKVRIVTPHC